MMISRGNKKYVTRRRTWPKNTSVRGESQTVMRVTEWPLFETHADLKYRRSRVLGAQPSFFDILLLFVVPCENRRKFSALCYFQQMTIPNH